MDDESNGGSHGRWARWRFAIIGRLLAAPPPRSELQAQIKALSEQTWRHPITGDPLRVGASTIERWLYVARKSNDPVRTLRRKVRADVGRRRVMSAPMREALRAQYREHPYWSYQLHFDNLGALARKDPTLGPMASYATVRRYMNEQGMRRRRRPRHVERAGVQLAEIHREQRETRSYEATHVNGLWHLDFHEAKRKVITASGKLIVPSLLGVLDDHSRMACHFQWYFVENTPNLIHGLSQAVQKRGLPRALLDDNGGAMIAAETREGLARLGITADHTLPARPEQNAKQENFWAQVEGRLMAMLEGCEDLTLAMLNEATQAWVECEYNQKEHSEIGVAPIERFLHAPSLGRPSPSSDELRRAFRATTTRKQRRSDGTFTLQGVRFEVPSRYRHLVRLTIRYASWDLSCVDLWDERTDAPLCAVYPLDKAKNADGRRRVLQPVAGAENVPIKPPRATGMAPLLRELMEHYAATGLPPAYLPTDIARGADDDDSDFNQGDVMNNDKQWSAYGLKWNPFSPDVPIEGLWIAPRVESFCTRVQSQARDGGFALVTGEPGLGKSVTMRVLSTRLETLRDVVVGTITRPRSKIGDFYREMGEMFGVPLVMHNRWGGFRALREKWLAHIDSTLMRPVLLVDEAQEMYTDVLSELRLLVSTQFDSRSILTVVLAGDARLPEMFRSKELLPLGSRMRVRITHDYASREELLACLGHRLDQAGNATLMTKELMETLCDHAAGNYRVLFTMAAELLDVAIQREIRRLDEKLYLEVFAAPVVRKPQMPLAAPRRRS